MDTITSKKFSLPLGQTGTQITKSLKWAVKDIYIEEELNSAATVGKKYLHNYSCTSAQLWFVFKENPASIIPFTWS